MSLPADRRRDEVLELRSFERVETCTEFTPSWRSLFAFTTRKHTFILTMALIATVASSLTKPAAAILFGRIFSSLTQYGLGAISIGETVRQISKWSLIMTALGLSVWLAEGIFLSMWMIFGELQAKGIRKQMFTGLLTKDMEWYDLRKDGIGTLLIRIQTQLRELQLAVSQPLGFLVYEICAATSSLILAFYLSWQLTLVIVAAFPISALLLWLISRKLSIAIEAQKRDLTLASKYANTAITSINTVKVFNGQDQELWQYCGTIENVQKGYLVQARANAMQFGVIKSFTIALFVSGFWYGLTLVRKGLDPGDMVTTFYTCLAAIQAFEIVLPQWLVLKKGMSAGETLKSIMTQIKDRKETGKSDRAMKPENCDGDIEMNQVSFAYPSNPNQPVLKNTNFFFPAGETTFIVGRSGSGKSTLTNLFLQYYKPLSGEILIDGCSVAEVDTEWLRKNVTVVQQQSVLFNDTILQNIAFGKQDFVSSEDIWEAAKTADLEKTILDMTDGFETMVGSNGKSLSGGQQQRIAIARARLRNSPVLILDEATSALDHTSRNKVNGLIRDWRKGKTTIIITHDVSQILDNEYVYVLEDGVVVQEGDRRKLADKSHGTFASFLPTVDDDMKEIQKKTNLSAPATPVAESPQDDFSHRWSYTSNVFGTRDLPHMMAGNWSAAEGKRVSMGIGSAFANHPIASAIWSSPPIGNDTSRLQPGNLNSPQRPTKANTPRLDSVNQRPFDSLDRNVSHLVPPPYAAINLKSRSQHDSLVPLGEINPGVTIERSSDEARHEETSVKVSCKQKSSTLTDILSTIWPTLIWRKRIILILGFAAAFIVACATPAFAFVFANLLSVFYLRENQDYEGRKLSLILLAIACLDGVAGFCYHYALEYCGQAWINALRVEAFKRILAQPRSWFDEPSNSAGKLYECLDRNAEEMRNLLGRFAGPVFIAMWILGISIVWSFTISWKLTIVALSTAPVMYIATRLFDHVSSNWEAKCNKVSEDASTIFSETFTNIRVVRALTLESHFEGKHTRAAITAFRTGQSRGLYSGVLWGLTDSIGFFISALIFYYGAILFSKDEYTVTQVLQVTQLLLFGISNSAATVAFVPQINNSRTTATQMLLLARLPHNPHEADGSRRLTTPLPVQFNNLSFAYPSRPETKALSQINLTFKQGTCTALVGPSGSGKSTIASILLGLYPPDPSPSSTSSPALTFSHTPIDACNIRSLRSHVSLVPQQPTLFPASILANITYGLAEDSPFNSLSCAARAARQAEIHDFIMGLEHGYATLIGDGGMGLSGGQAQRLAIARALVRRPKLLVLDEATSALDAVSAEVIRQTVRRLLARREVTVVLVSHGVEMMRIADEVVVVEEGRVVERGAFDELKARGGRFAALIGEKVKVPSRLETDFGGSLGVRVQEMTPVRPRSKLD